MLGPGCDLFGCLWSKLTLGIKGTSENFTSPLQVQHYPYSKWYYQQNMATPSRTVVQ